MEQLKTIWTGEKFILAFPNRDIELDIEETKLFEAWIIRKLEKKISEMKLERVSDICKY